MEKLPPVEPTMRDLPKEIALQLAEQIRKGDLPVGARLPSERELCSRYSVSRAVIREALSKLKSEALVAAKAGSGVYVTQINPSNAFRFQHFAMEDTDAFEQAMELLVAIEVAATRIAAIRRDDNDLKRIKRGLLGMEYAIASDKLGDNEDYEFHQAIVDATHNPHFQALCRHLEFGIRSIIRQARTNTRVFHAELLDAVQEEHHAIYDAIKASDAQAAAEAAERHLRNAAARFRIYLTDKN